MTKSLSPGFISLHGNRAEDLAQTVIDWLRNHPLDPLEEEVVLVQSNGMAEWFKMELARRHGVCSATRVELPSRFLWRTYRQVLGPNAVPRDSPLDKVPMTWRLMKVLPGLLDQPEFAPVKGYLRPDEPDRQLQLASKLADLFDQYQNYRADWLQAWASGKNILIQPDGSSVPVPADQGWQPQLWRAILATLVPSEHEAIRPRLHKRVLESLQCSDCYAGKVARRVVVYGMSHLPGAMLETLAALSRHCQVMLAVPNPCRYYWGDIIEGRELLKSQRRRHGLRQDTELSSVALEDMHQHAHPLLAAWGRQGRDFIRQLDAYDDAEATRQNFNLPRIDIFDDAPDDAHTSLLNRVQNRIRDLEPLRNESGEVTVSPQDRSITFQIAHSRVREMEVLQDHLLHLLDPDQSQDKPIQPRDIVVMVPDIEVMAPAIRAVFGQYQRYDKRYIPFDIADLSAKSSSPIISAMAWLLRLPSQRCSMSELLDLLEVPALAKRFGLGTEQLSRLTQWMTGAGIRWGLNQEHRQSLGLVACGEQNSAWFGLQRMLLGYACGMADAQGLDDVAPYAEVGGLDAELAGTLAHLIQALTNWWRLAEQEATPAQWVQRGRDLTLSLFKPADELDQKSLGALDEALTHWAAACEQAGFEEPLHVSAFRQAWMEALNVPSLERRFRAGGITFCTLMPMRAVPFEVVCLLGMNDGDYPRRTMNSDFDLMAVAGHMRPGDRSRRQDDRQLMLEALLSARRMLYISWTGHSVRDNSDQPPSVLVSQLRDYLSAAWGEEIVKQRTSSHPLQPFSRRYFEDSSALQTFAREWFKLHEQDRSAVKTAAPSLPVFLQDPAAPLTVQRLTTFFRNPVKVFFRERLGVIFEDPDEDAPDVEPFEVKSLENYQLIKDQVQSWPDAAECDGLPERIPHALQQLRRTGVLPMQGFGDLKERELAQTLGAMALAWRTAGSQFPHLAPRIPVEVAYGGVVLRDWVEQLHSSSPASLENVGTTAWLHLEPSKVLDKDGEVRPEKLLAAWLRCLATAACGHQVHGVLVGQDGVLQITPMAQEVATEQLRLLLQVWLEGMQCPLPLPLKTGLAVALDITTDKDHNPEGVYEGTDYDSSMAEVNDPCLARMYPDFETLQALENELGADGTESRLQSLSTRVYVPMLQWMTQHVTVK